MKYAGMPMGMWMIFHKSFQRNLTEVLKYDEEESRKITALAKKKYRELIERLPEFEKADRFKMNIVNCAMLSAFFLNMPTQPELSDATKYYKKSMMTGMMQRFCRMSGKKKYSESDIKAMKDTAKLKAGDRNPYSWNMDFYEYEDGSGYEARFTSCGSADLWRVGALPSPDTCEVPSGLYNERSSGVTDFVREYTLASGGPYCDCGYKKK